MLVQQVVRHARGSKKISIFSMCYAIVHIRGAPFRNRNRESANIRSEPPANYCSSRVHSIGSEERSLFHTGRPQVSCFTPRAGCFRKPSERAVLPLCLDLRLPTLEQSEEGYRKRTSMTCRLDLVLPAAFIALSPSTSTHQPSPPTVPSAKPPTAAPGKSRSAASRISSVKLPG